MRTMDKKWSMIAEKDIADSFFEPFKPQYPRRNSPDWSPYISLKI